MPDKRGTPPANEGRSTITDPAGHHSTSGISIPPRVDDEGEAWDDPRPLTETVSRAVFPTSALPEKVAAFVSSAARSIGVDEGVIGTVVLAVLSAATVGRVRVKAWGSLVERTVIWVLVVAEPGERKTSVFSVARQPLEAVQEKLRTEAGGVGRRIAVGRLAAANDALKSAERDLSVAYQQADDPVNEDTTEADLETANERVAAAAQRAAELAVPELPRLVASDVTAEALHDLMAAQGGRLALFVPEGQSLLHRLANAGNGSDLEPYLAGHGGDTMYRDRVTRTVDPVEDPSLVLAVMTQPEVLASKSTDEMRWSGFMDRFLLVRPRSLAGTRSARTAAIGAFELADYQRTVERMVREFWGLGEAREIVLAPDAEEVAVAFHDEIEPQLRGGQIPPGRSPGWAKKMVGAMLRIAGILAVTEDPGVGQISVRHVRAAIDLMRYFEAHTETVNRTLLDTEVSEQLGYATRVLDALARLHAEGHRRVSTRDVGRRVHGGRAQETDRALRNLAELEWVLHDDRLKPTPWVLRPGLAQWVEKFR